MKLYYTPGACSLASHIALREAGVPFELEKVDLGTKTTEKGADFAKVNPKGYVPALQLDNGEVLTEGVAIMQYAADQRPSTGIAPANGTMERYRLQEWLHYIGSEVHKSFGPLFGPFPEEGKAALKERIKKRLGEIDRHLAGRDWLLDRFTVADGYAFTVISWSKYVDLSLDPYPNVKSYLGRVAARPRVQDALKAEGLAG